VTYAEHLQSSSRTAQLHPPVVTATAAIAPVSRPRPPVADVAALRFIDRKLDDKRRFTAEAEMTALGWKPGARLTASIDRDGRVELRPGGPAGRFTTHVGTKGRVTLSVGATHQLGVAPGGRVCVAADPAAGRLVVLQAARATAWLSAAAGAADDVEALDVAAPAETAVATTAGIRRRLVSLAPGATRGLRPPVPFTAPATRTNTPAGHNFTIGEVLWRHRRVEGHNAPPALRTPDDRSRIMVGELTALLGWTPGVALSVTVADGIAAVRSAPGTPRRGSLSVDPAGRVRLGRATVAAITTPDDGRIVAWLGEDGSALHVASAARFGVAVTDAPADPQVSVAAASRTA
jgi:bifunctional DNA-binding transcriptional regulator/antitoxin component of YhaV-PrlF toxin-antitoxin module